MMQGKMKGVIVLLLSASFVHAAVAAPVFQGTGYLHFKDGDVVQFETLNPEWTSRTSSGAQNTLRVSRTEAESEIPLDWSLIKEVMLLGSGDWSTGERVHVTLRNGQEGKFVLSRSIDRFRYEYFDTFSQSEQRDLTTSRNVARIVFGDDFGDAKINPETGRIFPGSYRFDPYTGREFQWVDSNQQSFRMRDDQNIRVVRQYDYAETDVVVPGFSRGVPARAGEASTRQHGADDADQGSLEQAVIDYTTTFMNPFASSEEVSESLRKLRDQIVD